MHKIGILGHGFVGLAVESGMQLVGEVRIYDKYKSTESLYDVVNNSSILFLCLPTPMEEESGACNTDIIFSVAGQINKIAESSKICVIKSTVPPGTTEQLSKQFPQHGWIFNPEFLTERNFINDFLEQDRIFLGLTKNIKHKQVEQLEDLYEKFTETQSCSKKAKIFFCHSEEAEMLKYVSNCFLASKVIFFNEMKEICNKTNIDYERIIELVQKDRRIGTTHMNVPGPDGRHGFGGSCFAKDINALLCFARENNIDPLMLETVWAKNLLIREEYDWEILPQVNGEYENKT